MSDSDRLAIPTEFLQPHVKSYCQRCGRCWVYESKADYTVVSQSGVMHIGAEYGNTACGVDATGDRWWWKL